jgi:hypothetical protein
MVGMSTLREQLLGGGETPEFRLLLPAGWECQALDDGYADRVEREVRAVFMRAGRPDLDGRFTGQLQRGIAAARAEGAKHVILPLSPDGDAPLPMSLVVATTQAPAGGTLDAWVSGRIRAGATMLDDDGRIVTWRSDAVGEGEEAGTRQWQSHYVAAVPGTGRTRAVIVTATLLGLAEDDAETPEVVAARALFDAIVSTLAWVAPTTAEVS